MADGARGDGAWVDGAWGDVPEDAQQRRADVLRRAALYLRLRQVERVQEVAREERARRAGRGVYERLERRARHCRLCVDRAACYSSSVTERDRRGGGGLKRDDRAAPGRGDKIDRQTDSLQQFEVVAKCRRPSSRRWPDRDRTAHTRAWTELAARTQRAPTASIRTP